MLHIEPFPRNNHKSNKTADWNFFITSDVSLKEDLCSKKKVIKNQKYWVKVFFRPGISVSGTKFVEKGDPIHLVCNSTGRLVSPDNLDWFKDGVKLLPSGLRKIKIDKFHVPQSLTLVSVLDIRHSQMEDAGTYVCRSSDLSITSTKVHVLNGELRCSCELVSIYLAST